MAKGKGTNSLAFARTDCHTCVSAARTCDRRRPQCLTCRELGVKCGGFATPLSWDNNRIWFGQPSQTKVYICDGNRRGERSESPRPSTPSRTFRFVNGNSKRKRRRRFSPISSPHGEYGCALETIGTGSGFESYTAHPPGSLVDDFDPLLLDDHEALDAAIPFAQDCLPDLMFTAFPVQESQEPMDLPALPPPENDSPGPSNIFTQSLIEMPNSTATNPFENQLEMPHIPPSPTRLPAPEISTELSSNQIGSQNEILFQMYDTELCVLPLTSDVALNPFRCRRQTLEASRLLCHAILALCCQHQYHLTGTWSDEASEHRTRASELLENASQSDQVARVGLNVLEPILIMFTLDCTVSAAGPWGKHLMRVRSILDACGGPLALDTSRVRSQVGMLFWWDATLALISRQGTFIDQSYLEHLIQSQGQDEWSFYDLTGCPSDLFVHLAHLAELAKQREIAACMTWLHFDLSPVIKIEREIQNWQCPAFADGYSPNIDNLVTSPSDAGLDDDTEEDFHSRQDRHHCAEAWRYALLIYIERVFRWDRESPQPGQLKRLVRKTLDHVRCCRRTSQTQKQLLLPVFLAGSETGDVEMRRFTREYCRWWANRSRYNMFNSASALLDEVWERDGEDSWWGAVVDRKTQGGGGGGAVQFLLG